jgi:uncharacterized protein YbaR (Trm112 family)
MTSNRLDPRLLEILACPTCSKPAPLKESADGNSVTCDKCERSFPVHDGIVTLLPETNASGNASESAGS